MVEVALVLPIVIFTLLAVIEMGYFVAVGSAVSSASREAARYGAVVGCVDDDCSNAAPGTPEDFHYVDCAGIRDAARLTSGALVNLTDNTLIEIDYVPEGSETAFDSCPVGGPGPHPEDDIDPWDRIAVTVRYTYQPLTPLVGAVVGSVEMVSIDRRSIICDC
jgi:TadE-like protein